MLTPLHDKLAAAGARTGEYCGAQSAADFGDVKREFAALRSGTAVFDLGWRSKITITGGDRVRWLNGMVSNNIRDLALGRGVYSFLLNPQGRIQGDMYCYNRGEYFLIDTDASQAPLLRQLLQKYIIMDDVKLADASEKLTAIGLAGPSAAEVLRASEIFRGELQPLEIQDVVWRNLELSLVRTDEEVVPRFEIWLAPDKAAMVWDALLAAGAAPVGFEAVELLRIWSGRPRYGQDIRDRDLPQETGQNRALHHNKGCYIGQEIVERIRSRGAVHRMFTGFALEGPAPAPGTKISVNGKEAGEITSAARIPLAEGERTVALGYIRREAGAQGATVDAGGAAAVITALPFQQIMSAA